ncbi:unnamed protein product [Cuscuta epithymum]|uniref:Uncharacterized protein n=1 Tax=Cuscuta epithymum TaxID=186058 RepID=A0AAV0GLE7_9ASTE|nr:unnamed protein product [Cuscuta epithymum]CAH9148766.1 unnamed protein product [Cuscuta epithymum]
MPSGPKKRRAAKNKEAAAKVVSSNAHGSGNTAESTEKASLTLMNTIVSDASTNKEPEKVVDASSAPEELSRVTKEWVNGNDDEKASKVINECCIASSESVQGSNESQICNNGGPSEGKAEHISSICVDNVSADPLKGDDDGPEEIGSATCIAESEVKVSAESVKDSATVAATNASIGTPVAADVPEEIEKVACIAESEAKVSLESVEATATITAAVQSEILEVICQKDDISMTEKKVSNNEKKDAPVMSSEIAAKDADEFFIQKDGVKVVNGSEITCNVEGKDYGAEFDAEFLTSKINEVVSSISVAHDGKFITHLKLMFSAIGFKDFNAAVFDEHYSKLMEVVEQFEREAQEFKAVLFMLRKLKMSAAAALTT